MPAALLAPVLSEAIFSTGTDLQWNSVAEGIIISLALAGASVFARRVRHLDPFLPKNSDRSEFFLITLAATLVSALTYTEYLLLADVIPRDQFTSIWQETLLSQMTGLLMTGSILLTLIYPWFAQMGQPRWINDGTAPTGLPQVKREARILRLLNPYLMVAILFLGLWIALIPALQGDFHYLSLVMLPLLWSGLAYGNLGTSITATFISSVLALSILISGYPLHSMSEVQIVIFTTLTTGLFLGGAVSERMRANQAQQKKSARLLALQAIYESILTSRSSHEVAQVALSHLQKVVPCTGSRVIEFDKRSTGGVILARSGSYGPILGHGVLDHLRLSDVESASQRHETVTSEARRALSASPPHPSNHPQGTGPQSIDVPLQAHGELIGSLSLQPAKTGSLAADDLETTKQMADLLAIALQQTRLTGQIFASRARLGALSRRLIDAQETERRLIALELHDEVAQTLTRAKMNIRAASQGMGDSVDNSQIDQAMDLVDSAMNQIRSLALNLRPPLLDDLGLSAALKWHVDQWSRRTGINVSVNIKDLPPSRYPQLETTMFRVAQEALNNVHNHAIADKVVIEVSRDDSKLSLNVSDNGIGFYVQSAMHQGMLGKTMGLLSMQERVDLCGGYLDIRSQLGEGTTIVATLPLSPDQKLERRLQSRDR